MSQQLFADILQGDEAAWQTYTQTILGRDQYKEIRFLEFIFSSKPMQSCVALFHFKQGTHDSKRKQALTVGAVQDSDKDSLYKQRRDELEQTLSLIPHDYLLSLLKYAVFENLNNAIPIWCLHTVRVEDPTIEMQTAKQTYKYIFTYTDGIPMITFYDKKQANLPEILPMLQVALMDYIPHSFPLKEPALLSEDVKHALHKTVTYYYTVTLPSLVCLNLLESQQQHQAFMLHAMLALFLKPRFDFKQANIILSAGISNYGKLYKHLADDNNPVVQRFNQLMTLCQQKNAERSNWRCVLESKLDVPVLMRQVSTLYATSAHRICWSDESSSSSSTGGVKKKGGMKRKRDEQPYLEYQSISREEVSAGNLTRSGTLILGEENAAPTMDNSLSRVNTPELERVSAEVLSTEKSFTPPLRGAK